MDNKKKQQKETEDNGLLGCVFCHGTGIATFVDMSKVPDYTSMVMGDETWKKYEELGNCPEGCVQTSHRTHFPWSHSGMSLY